MRSLDVRLSFRPTLKNQVYLQRLGYLDARTGRMRKDSPDFSRFINECVTNVCEMGRQNNVEIVGSDVLREAYRKHQILILARKVDELNKEIDKLRKVNVEITYWLKLSINGG